MLPEFGQFALILALCLALVQATVPLVGSWRGRLSWMALSRPLAYGQFCFVALSFVILAHAFLTNDFSVQYVAANSNTDLPTLYKFCAIWGAHEGSLLLWIFVLSLWTALVAVFSKSLPSVFTSRVLSVLGMIAVGFLLFILLTSDPFTRLLPLAPANGNSLNPILQDPGLAIHPPMLYMGYVGFSIAFAFAIAALIGGRLDASWARWSRPWTLMAWCFLTFGITLGSWWSYRQLGWGGWWFWDPVENASFLPWLTGTALIHSLAVTEKRNSFKGWTVLLAIFAFTLSLLGTFLVRSGVLTSVHAFAEDPKRGVFLLEYIAVVVGASLFIYALRAPKIRKAGDFQLFSRETLLLSNNVILVVSMVTILLGTTYPLVMQAFGLDKISVGVPYYNSVFVPLMVPLLFLIGIGPHTYWRGMSWQKAWQELRWTLAASILLGCSLPWFISGSWHSGVALGMSLAFWVAASTTQLVWAKRVSVFKYWLSTPRARKGMIFAHIGLAICVMGIVLSNAYSIERDVVIVPGGNVEVGPYRVHFDNLEKLQGPNYHGVTGIFSVFKGDTVIATLNAEKRIFNVSQMAKTQAAINASVFRDIYLSLGEPVGASGQRWGLRAYYKPFVRWIWAGGLLMLLGGLCAASDKRYRQRKQKHAALS